MTTAVKLPRGQVLLFPAGFSCPRDFDPVEFHRTLRKARKEAQADIERLLWFLDATEIDPDLEPDVDAEPDEDGEPSLGSLQAIDQLRWSLGSGDDLEHEHHGREASLCGVTFEAPSNSRDLEWDAGDMPEGIPW